MLVKQQRPLTAGQRFLIKNKLSLSGVEPERKLVKYKHRAKGRNCYGRITSRRRGGGHKRLYRLIDFKRDKIDIPAVVKSIEYDPNRSANLALLAYADGEKRYILAVKGLSVGDKVVSKNTLLEDYTPGMNLPLKFIPPSTRIHAVELLVGKGAQLARSAGSYVQLVSFDGDFASIKLPSGELRLVPSDCRATIGEVDNALHKKQSLGKAGRNRWKGRRPRVRGVAMNPVDHPMGGGEGRTSGGGHPVSPWGQLAKGFPTRKKSRASNAFILVRRNGKRLRKG